MRVFPLFAISAAVTLSSVCSPGRAQTAPGKAPEYQVKTRYIATLAEYASWPAQARPKIPGQPIIVGILGTAPFDRFLVDLETRYRIHESPIELIYLRQPSEARSCHIVFICTSEAYRITEVINLLRGFPVLTIGDTPGFAAKGIMINLLPVRDRIYFEINPTAIKANGLEMSSHVLKLARIVE